MVVKHHQTPTKVILQAGTDVYRKLSDRVHSSRGPKQLNVIKTIDKTPCKYAGRNCPINLDEQKKRFLLYGIPPQFVLNKPLLTNIDSKGKHEIRFDYLNEARTILELVGSKYGDGDDYLNEAFGPRITATRASEILSDYLAKANMDTDLTVYWTPDLTCSARMMWHGPSLKYNKPESRKYTLLLNTNQSENAFLREKGITCLADHEIGTHFYRMLNDGLQPWFSDRKRFGMGLLGGRQLMCTEEGLAAVNTVLRANKKYLWNAALTYYIACMADSMTFKELFDDIEKYIKDPDYRFKCVMRVKRYLKDTSCRGGSGTDQCYFEGAVYILRNVDEIDFNVLYSGRVCLEEVKRIKRLARMDCIRFPKFLKYGAMLNGDNVRYKRKLHQIAVLNRLVDRNSINRPLPQHNNARKEVQEEKRDDQQSFTMSPYTTPRSRDVHAKLPSCEHNNLTSRYKHKVNPLYNRKSSNNSNGSSRISAEVGYMT